MAIVHGRTRAELRQSIGYNLGAVYVSSASGSGSTTTIVDSSLIGSDDNHIGKWVIFNDADGTAGQVTRVSDYTSSSTTLTVSPAISASVASDTYELWDDIYPPARINDLINQSILDATGATYDPVESLALHSDGKTLRFDVPSGLSMIQNIYRRSAYTSTRIHACAEAFDETVDSDITVSLDTKDRRQGTQSCKFVIAAGASAGDIATDSITSKNLASHDYIEMWVKSTVATSSGNLKLLLDDTASCVSPLETLSIPALTADTWTFVRMSLANPETDCTVWLDDISAVRNDTAHWEKIPRNLWKIDKQESDIIFDRYVHGVAPYDLLKIVGGDKPALLTSDSATPEIDEQYIVARATGLAFASASGGPNTDPDNKNNMAGFWMGLSQQARRAFPMLTDIRLVQ
jgi:hypothetical protein